MGAYNTAATLALAMCFMCRYSIQSPIKKMSSADNAVMGDMGQPILLPGFLDSPTSVFYKDGLRISPDSPLYSVTHAANGYQVAISFLSCSDEGRYVLGGKSFVVIARPQILKHNNRGVYYHYTHKTRGTVDEIYMLTVERDHLWRVVWNSTMDENHRPTDCCPTSAAYRDGSCRMCIYKQIGPANQMCSRNTDSIHIHESSYTQCTYSLCKCNLVFCEKHLC